MAPSSVLVLVVLGWNPGSPTSCASALTPSCIPSPGSQWVFMCGVGRGFVCAVTHKWRRENDLSYQPSPFTSSQTGSVVGCCIDRL